MASPYLQDSNFLRSVVYILQHDGDGAFGLILNRPLNITVGQLASEMTGIQIDNDQPVYNGGPVEGLVVIAKTLVGAAFANFAVLTKEEEGISNIVERLKSGDSSVRVFDGYSGWGPSQLDGELAEGSWLVWDVQPEILFGNSDGLWEKAVMEIGREVIAKSIAGVPLPQDPSQN